MGIFSQDGPLVSKGSAMVLQALHAHSPPYAVLHTTAMILLTLGGPICCSPGILCLQDISSPSRASTPAKASEPCSPTRANHKAAWSAKKSPLRFSSPWHSYSSTDSCSSPKIGAYYGSNAAAGQRSTFSNDASTCDTQGPAAQSLPLPTAQAMAHPTPSPASTPAPAASSEEIIRLVCRTACQPVNTPFFPSLLTTLAVASSLALKPSPGVACLRQAAMLLCCTGHAAE